MKINNKKIIVSTLCLAMGAALAGSISGTVAWYQYSTRATTQLSGTSAGTSRNLQIAQTLANPAATDNMDDANWGYNIKPAEKDLTPLTPYIIDGKVDGFAKHPVYQYFNNWVAAENDDNYFSYTAYLQSIDENGDREALEVYLTKVEFDVDDIPGAGEIIRSALRLEIVPETYDAGESKWVKGASSIFSYDGEATSLKDYLNLNTPHNDVMDRDGFAADDSEGDAVMYKANKAVVKAVDDDGTGLYTDPECTSAAPATIAEAGTYYQKNADSYTTKKLGEGVGSFVAGDADPYNFTNKTDHVIISTDSTYAVKLNIKVWLEGWQKDAANGSKVLAEGTNTTGYYTDSECSSAAPANHSVGDKAIGDDGTGLFSDAACNTPAVVDANGKLTAAGEYFAKGADGSTEFYFNNYIWDNASIGTAFKLNLRFGVEAEQ